MIAELRDILAPLAERRQIDIHDMQPVIEVFPKKACRHTGLEIGIGGADDPDVAFRLPGGSHAQKVSLLQHPQQLYLQRRRHAVDFIEKEGAPSGRFQQSFFLLAGPGEGPFFVAEQFRFQERFVQGSAVEGQESAIGPAAGAMDETGRQLFAGAGFAGDEHGDVERRRQSDQLLHLPNLPGGADHFVGLDGGELRCQLPVFLNQGEVLHRFFHRKSQFLGVEGLLDVIMGSGLHGLDGRIDAAVAGYKDHRQIGVAPEGGLENFVAAEVRHLEVGDDRVEGFRLEQQQPLPAVPAGGDLIALAGENLLQQFPLSQIVIDDQ